MLCKDENREREQMECIGLQKFCLQNRNGSYSVEIRQFQDNRIVTRQNTAYWKGTKILGVRREDACHED